MPTGTGAETLTQIPDVPYVIDPATFFAMTERQVFQAQALPAPGPGAFVPWNLPRVGVVSKLTITFVGSVTIATGGTQPVWGWRWPYGLLSLLRVSANGQNDLFNCDGLDLHALRAARYPYYQEHVDQFPGAVGGGGAAPAAGTYPLYLTWEVPFAIDDISLGASIFAQSSATNIAVQISQELAANLIAPGGTAADVTITGNFEVEPTIWEIPVDAHGRLVLPDITRLHTVIGLNTNFANVGDVAAPLIRTAGQMERLFVSAMSATNVPLNAMPSTPTANLIDRIRLQYGGVHNPLDYNPAARLLAKNGQEYGNPLPYDRFCFDFIRQNATRDVVFYQGVTELKAIVTVDAAVAVGAGAVVRTVQESLI